VNSFNYICDPRGRGGWPRLTRGGGLKTVPGDGRTWISAHVWLRKNAGITLAQLIHQLGGPPPRTQRGRGGMNRWSVETLTQEIHNFVLEHRKTPNSGSGSLWASAHLWLRRYGTTLREVSKRLEALGPCEKCKGPVLGKGLCRSCVPKPPPKVYASRQFHGRSNYPRRCSRCRTEPKTGTSTYCAKCRKEYFKAWKAKRRKAA
jgi:hypothetical protein